MLYTSHMKLIIGLGNPEERFNDTRHNVGFRMLDSLAAGAGVNFRSQSKFRADIAEWSLGGEKVLLVKPTTYYNLVGESARALMDFYKLSPSDVLILHDDLALPLGTVRTRLGGSDAGNNGIKSLNTHLGTDTARIRIGVWTDHHHGLDKASIVLGKFTRDELVTLDTLESTIAMIVQKFARHEFTATTYGQNVPLHTKQENDAADKA